MYLVTFITLYIIACTYNCVKHFTRLTDARHALAHLDNNAKVRVNVTHLHILGSTASKPIDILWATIIWIISINVWENNSVSINMASVGGCYVHNRFNTFIYGKIQFTMAFCIQVPLVYSHYFCRLHIGNNIVQLLYDCHVYFYIVIYIQMSCIKSRANWTIWTLVRLIKKMVMLNKEANNKKPDPKLFGLILAGFVSLMSVNQFTFTFTIYIVILCNYIYK